MACFAYENFAFCDLKMPSFWTYFSLNVWVYDGGLYGPLRKKILHWWAKGAKFQALFLVYMV